jgi:hypothetical protein
MGNSRVNGEEYLSARQKYIPKHIDFIDFIDFTEQQLPIRISEPLWNQRT